MKKLWQSKWFEIKFNDFIKVNPNIIADEAFYKKFYEKFYEKYQSFDDLPDIYINNKISIAQDILGFSEKYKSIMSIGCGNGIIENYIVNNSSKYILAIEPSDNTRWLSNTKNLKLIQGFFQEILNGEPKYEFGYGSSIDYVFNDQEYVDFLQQIYSYNFKEFYLTEIIVPPTGVREIF